MPQDPRPSIVLRRIDIHECAGVVHLDVDNAIAVDREHGLGAGVRIRRAQIRKHRSIEDHRVAMPIFVGRPNDRRARAAPRFDHRGHRRRPHHRHVDERDERPFDERRVDRIQAGDERRQLSPFPSQVFDDPRARFVRRHCRAHRVDVRAGHHDHFRRSTIEQRTDDPREHGFARLTERQRRLRLPHSRRCAGGQDDRRDHENCSRTCESNAAVMVIL